MDATTILAYADLGGLVTLLTILVLIFAKKSDVSALKQEVTDLKESYRVDMKDIKHDIRHIRDKLDTETKSNP